MEKRFDAVLFDVGHTLFDYVRPFPELWSEVFERRGMTLAPDEILEVFTTQTTELLGAAPTFDGMSFEAYQATWLRVATATARALRFAGDAEEAAEAMWHALVVEKVAPFSDVRRTLDALTVRGYQLGVVANWNVTLEYALSAHGLARYLRAIVPSAVVGAEEPDPSIFQAALGQLGVSAHRAVVVGDTYEHDIVGARAAGLHAILLQRGTLYPSRQSVPTIRTLDELLREL